MAASAPVPSEHGCLRQRDRQVGVDTGNRGSHALRQADGCDRLRSVRAARCIAGQVASRIDVRTFAVRAASCIRRVRQPSQPRRPNSPRRRTAGEIVPHGRIGSSADPEPRAGRHERQVTSACRRSILAEDESGGLQARRTGCGNQDFRPVRPRALLRHGLGGTINGGSRIRIRGFRHHGARLPGRPDPILLRPNCRLGIRMANTFPPPSAPVRTIMWRCRDLTSAIPGAGNARLRATRRV